MNQLISNWWTVALRGALAIAIGIIALVFPGITLSVLIALFGVFALIEGVFLLIIGIRSWRGSQRWWSFILQGVLSLIVGILALLVPTAMAIAFVYLMAFWAVLAGIVEITAAVQLRKVIRGEWLMAAAGAITILFGIGLMLAPVAGLLAVVWLFGIFAVLSGVLLLVLAFRLRREEHGGHLAHANV